MGQDEERAVDTVSGWRVLLPPGWSTFPTEPEAARKAISSFLDRVFEGKPRDELAPARIELDRALRQQAREAAKAGARYLHALTRPIRGLPVSATMLAVPVQSGNPDELASALSHVLGAASGVVENGHVDAGDLPALRRVRREPIALGGAPDDPEQMATHVDYVVLLPDQSLLVLAFSTMTEPVHRELVVLFDAIAGSLHAI
ncbi:MAG: hypothetical protein ACR2FG_04590 [Marmoricola sp.]